MTRRATASLLVVFVALLGISAQAAELEQIGTFDFPSSASPEAQQHFLRGVGYLHSFGMTQAQEEFKKAQEIDPDFALAYWGEAFTYQHPFFGAVDDRPGEALMKLAPTPAARLAKAPTEREKGFLKAAEAYALTPGGMAERRTAWMQAMGELYAKYPDDDEVKAFYTAATLAAATAAGPMRERLNMRAGAMALELFKENDNHPGAAHYVIHSFDDPLHAPIALEAAHKYASIAPAVSHARHMPTHIFIQHGMWQQVSQWNESAFQAARDLWKPGDTVGDQNHSSDWGQYGDLQLGDLERSKLWIERAGQTLAENDGDRRSMGTLTTMQARHIIESQQWELQELSDDLSANELLALGLSAVNLEEAELAQDVAARLAALASDSPNNNTLKLINLEVGAMARLIGSHDLSGSAATAAQDEAMAMLDEAIAITERGRLPNGAANPLKPVHELTGEVMLHAGDFARAAELFETSLLRMPNRPLSLIGAARAYDKLGERDKANEKYSALLSIWNDEDHPLVQEARQFLAVN